MLPYVAKETLKVKAKNLEEGRFSWIFKGPCKGKKEAGGQSRRCDNGSRIRAREGERERERFKDATFWL